MTEQLRLPLRSFVVRYGRRFFATGWGVRTRGRAGWTKNPGHAFHFTDATSGPFASGEAFAAAHAEELKKTMAECFHRSIRVEEDAYEEEQGS